VFILLLTFGQYILEINEFIKCFLQLSAKPIFELDSSSLFKLLRALNECTEWGQVFILDSLASHTVADAKEAESIIERVVPRLQHANSAVVLSAVKVVLKNLDALGEPGAVNAMVKKLAPPLVTLLSSEPEIQYVALRCMNLVVQRFAGILTHEVKVFFCKYNDPIYVKMEKLEIMIRLATDKNIDQVLLEFKEYATEVDVDFVRRAVRAIGRCAVSFEAAAERCINVSFITFIGSCSFPVRFSAIAICSCFLWPFYVSL
jgi:AP-1 complex subunit beta-1